MHVAKYSLAKSLHIFEVRPLPGYTNSGHPDQSWRLIWTGAACLYNNTITPENSRSQGHTPTGSCGTLDQMRDS